jgi:transglutaminase-like putative cysteine protease
LGKNRYTLLRAAPPSGKAAAERPVKGSPSPQDAPFLAATPLAQFNDPVFDGLVRRLNAPPGATRWELAQRITSFVYDWIRDKNYTVGFASAQEVARTPKGDCTEHGVLAVALLRRLGVPARGVTGWMAFGDSMGLHFWVEARIGGRWVPLDPTFNQAPASAFRLKLGTSDLADLGSVGWESAAMSFTAGSWIPEAPWAAEVRIQGDTIMAPGGARIRVPGGRWSQIHGRLELLWEGRHGVEAVPPPAPALVASALRLQGGEERGGWWDPALRQLWMDAGGGKWLRVDALAEDQAFRLLEGLETQHPRVLKEAA